MKIIMTLAVGCLGWRVFKKLGLPAPAMIGSMVAVGIANVLFHNMVLPVFVKVFAQAMSGAFIGMQITKREILNFRYLLKPFFILITALTINTFVIGILIHLISGMSYPTALLGCVAGGVSDIAMISMEMDADTAEVALMQTARLAGVLLVFPYWIKFFTRNEGDAGQDIRLITGNVSAGDTWLDLVISTPRIKLVFTVLLSLLCGIAGQASRIPAGSMIVPMAAIALLNINTSTCYMPIQIKNTAQLLAGTLVGLSISYSTLTGIGTMVVPLILLLTSYWGVNLIYSLYCKKTGLLDLKSAMFASAPGGATDMSLIAADLHADMARIALIQVLRAVYAVTFMPAVITLFAAVIK